MSFFFEKFLVFSHVDRKLEFHDRKVDTTANTAVAGQSIGLLVAATYSLCASVDDLKRLAVFTVAMAFELGLEADTKSALIYELQSELRSWSLFYPDMAEAEAHLALEAYNAQNHLYLGTKCFIMVVGVDGVIINNPPTILSRFAESQKLSQPAREANWLPNFAAFHSPHIHCTFDFSSFLSRCAIEERFLASFLPIRNVLSSSAGTKLEYDTGMDVFRIVIHEILQAPNRLDYILGCCAQLARESGNRISNMIVTIVGPISVADRIAAGLRDRVALPASTLALVLLNERHDANHPVPSRQQPLAIVGVSGRFPGGENIQALWETLRVGLDVHRQIPKDRCSIETHVDPTGKRMNTSWTPYGCFIDNPGDFDPLFFNISPREALQIDPQQRLALVTAYEALEMAGFVPGRTLSSIQSRVGVFYGQSSDDYRDSCTSQEIGTHFMTGEYRSFGTGQINHFFRFGGPSYIIDTACSSALGAIQLACNALQYGDCDTALAGGLNIIASPDRYAGLSRGQFLSRTDPCKTLDEGADGYCRGDGIGTVVIKRLADAQMDNDRILGVIRAAGTNHSGLSSLTHPHAETQARLYREVLGRVGLSPDDVGYIEVHGTGTQAGDFVEMCLVMDVFATEDLPREENNPLYLGSAKPNIGHSEAASGLASLIKTLLVLDRESIPPHVGVKTELKRKFGDLTRRNIQVPTEKTPFPRKQSRERISLVNSFGAAGGNTCILIEEPPVPRHRDMILGKPRVVGAH